MSSPYVLGKEPAPSDAIYPTAALSLETPATERKLELEDKEKSASPSLLESGASRAEELLAISWKYKWVALLCTALFPVGQNWTDSALGPLKATLRTELGISNTQYGVIDAAGAIVNSIWPILGGVCLDFYGVNVVSLVCTSTILVGSIVAALAANTGIWRMLVGGHILMGFGTAVLDSAQHKLFYHWFGASGLAFAFGLESAIAKTTSLVSGMSTIPIKERTGWYGWSFWIPVVTCFLSLLVNIFYVIFERKVIPKHLRLTGSREAEISKSQKRPSFSALWLLPWAFWMLPMTQLFQSEAAGAFGNSSTDLITMKGYTESVAAFTANAKNILPIVLTPVIGFCVDRWGHRFHLTALAPLLWITACAVIGFSDIHPLLPVIISSLAGTINAFPFQITIPLLLRDQSKLGTAFGVWRCFNNSGSTSMSIIYGIVQDQTAAMGYTNVLLIGIGFKTLAFFLGLFYIFVDFKYLGKGMTMSEGRRNKLEEEIENEDTDLLTARPVKKWVTMTALCELFVMVVAAWTLFIKYVI